MYGGQKVWFEIPKMTKMLNAAENVSSGKTFTFQI